MTHSLVHQTQLAPGFLRDAWKRTEVEALRLREQFPYEFEEIHIAGCGDSYFAGLGIEMAFNLWTDRIARAGPALKVGRYRMHELLNPDRRALVLGISASGEVARTLEVIDLANRADALTLGITGNPESSLARIADDHFSIPMPELPHGPGLLSYLGSLLMGYALCITLVSDPDRVLFSKAIEMIPDQLEGWISIEHPRGVDLAEKVAGRDSIMFVGAGPAYSSAKFSAAKVVEACGVPSWGQDLEEWAHIEYFLEPASMPTWLLSAEGRSRSREIEIEHAAKTIGRRVQVSRWIGWDGLSSAIREAISPLILWVGPTSYAARMSQLLGEESFRGFRGGRSRAEGGGASRVRSSERVDTFDDLGESKDKFG